MYAFRFYFVKASTYLFLSLQCKESMQATRVWRGRQQWLKKCLTISTPAETYFRDDLGSQLQGFPCLPAASYKQAQPTRGWPRVPLTAVDNRRRWVFARNLHNGAHPRFFQVSLEGFFCKSSLLETRLKGCNPEVHDFCQDNLRMTTTRHVVHVNMCKIKPKIYFLLAHDMYFLL